MIPQVGKWQRSLVFMCDHPIPPYSHLGGMEKQVQLSADAEFQAKRFSLNKGGQRKPSSVFAAEAYHQDQTSICRAKATANPGAQSCLGQGCNDPQPGPSYGAEELRPERQAWVLQQTRGCIRTRDPVLWTSSPMSSRDTCAL